MGLLKIYLLFDFLYSGNSEFSGFLRFPMPVYSGSLWTLPQNRREFAAVWPLGRPGGFQGLGGGGSEGHVLGSILRSKNVGTLHQKWGTPSADPLAPTPIPYAGRGGGHINPPPSSLGTNLENNAVRKLASFMSTPPKNQPARGVDIRDLWTYCGKIAGIAVSGNGTLWWKDLEKLHFVIGHLVILQKV